MDQTHTYVNYFFVPDTHIAVLWIFYFVIYWQLDIYQVNPDVFLNAEPLCILVSYLLSKAVTI